MQRNTTQCKVEVAGDCADPDTFYITDKGRQGLELTQAYHNPKLFAQFRLHDLTTGQVSDLSPFEAMLELTRRSWTYVKRKPSKKLDAYCPGGQKIWYYSSTVCRHYLQVLLNVDKLFAGGLNRVVHFQPSSYYKTLLFMLEHNSSKLNDVKPWQTLAFYTVLRQQARRRGRARTANNVNPEMEEEGGWYFMGYILDWIVLVLYVYYGHMHTYIHTCTLCTVHSAHL